MLIASFLALGSAIGWGTSDYFGGEFSRRHGLLTVLLGSQVASFLVLAAVVGSIRDPLPGSEYVWAAVIAGLGEVIATAALYRGVATGAAAIAAPAASAAPLVPLALSIAQGTLPQAIQLVAAGVVMVGVALTMVEPDRKAIPLHQAAPRAHTSAATPPATRARLASLGWGSVAALGFGSYFVAMDTASQGGILWALMLARSTAVGAILCIAAALAPRRPTGTRGARDLSPVTVLAIAGIGMLVLLADALYATSTTLGNLTLVAVLSAAHPAVTVLWARTHRGERLGLVRAIGVVTSVGGVLAITSI